MKQPVKWNIQGKEMMKIYFDFLDILVSSVPINIIMG